MLENNCYFNYILWFSPLLLFVSVTAQNFHYDEDDWYILTKPGSIISITEDNFNLYFAAENGVYRYDKGLEDFKYDFSFSMQLRHPRLKHIHYDSYRDYFWVVHQEGLSYKPSISSIWREVSLWNSGIHSYFEIDDIGSSPEYFWLRSNDALYPFDPFSAEPADWQIAEGEIDLIRWGYSQSGEAGLNIPISEYIMEGEWNIGLDYITHRDGRRIRPTVFMEDGEGNQWFGTDSGFILKGWRYSSRLELLTIGLPFDHVTTTYQDQTGDWWFSDSHFKRTGQLSSFFNDLESANIPFVCQWNESENFWTYYMPNESVVIQHTDVNSILRVGSTMYFGTMFGLLYLDLFNRDWNLIDATNGLNDSAVWDVIEHQGSLYLATANGLNEISIINHSIIPDRVERFEELTQLNIYDLEADTQYLYLSTDAGLLQLDWNGDEIITLSKKDFRKIKSEETGIAGTDGSLWVVAQPQNEVYLTSNVYDFDICGSYIWTTQTSQVTLLDTVTAQTWIYNQEDGIPGNKIYGVNCDKDWVWILTNKGVAYYNWNRYHHEKN